MNLAANIMKTIILFLAMTTAIFAAPLASQKETHAWVNQASALELQAVKGVGKQIANRVIEARPFSPDNDTLIRVKGIGPTLEKRIREHVADILKDKER